MDTEQLQHNDEEVVGYNKALMTKSQATITTIFNLTGKCLFMLGEFII